MSLFFAICNYIKFSMESQIGYHILCYLVELAQHEYKPGASFAVFLQRRAVTLPPGTNLGLIFFPQCKQHGNGIRFKQPFDIPAGKLAAAKNLTLGDFGFNGLL